MFRTLYSDRNGNVAMIFALCLIPLLMLMGGAIDLSRQRGSEVGAQNALDAALLAVAHEALGKNEAELTKDARSWFEAQLLNSNMDIVSFEVSKTDSTLFAQMVGKVDTTFLAIFGIGDLKVVRTAQVQFGLQKVEVALVLDTTGSMGNIASETRTCGKYGCTGGKTKLKVLQEAATSMMNALETANADTDQLQVSIVPFATYVNVGKENINESWLDTEGKSPIHGDNLVDGLNRLQLYNHLGYEWKGCVEARPHPHEVRDTTPRISKPETLFVPVFHPDEPDAGRYGNSYPNNYVGDAASLGIPFLDVGNPIKYGVPDSILVDLVAGLSGTTRSLANGLLNGSDDCEGSVDLNNGLGNNDCLDPYNSANWEKVTVFSNYKFYSDVTTTIGPQFGCEMRPITPLTADYDKLRSEIDQLVASGSTNTSEGIAWGWRVLSPGAPFKEADKYSDGVNKVLVLLSDGNNMIVERSSWPGKSDYSAYGYLANERLDGTDANSDQGDILDAMDDLTLETCKNVKASGVRIITIRLDQTDSRSAKILKTCASSEKDYIDVQNTSELTDAFAKVTENITRLYLSK